VSLPKITLMQADEVARAFHREGSRAFLRISCIRTPRCGLARLKTT
jgi:hypothetical protein